jgi:hypothetical protein
MLSCKLTNEFSNLNQYQVRSLDNKGFLLNLIKICSFRGNINYCIHTDAYRHLSTVRNHLKNTSDPGGQFHYVEESQCDMCVLHAWLPYSLNLKMEAIHFPETSVNFCQTPLCS